MWFATMRPTGTFLSIFLRNFRNSWAAVAALQLADHGAVGDVEAANRLVTPWRA
jgi:hypothetical protein